MERRVFEVDYYFYPPGSTTGTRTQLLGNTGQNGMADATSEFAVLRYLESRHPNTRVEILNLKWVG